MRAGRLRYRAEFQEVSEADDGYGGTTETWATVKTRSVAMRDLTGSEGIYASKVAEGVNVEVRMRHQDWLTSAHRILVAVGTATRTLHIDSVLDPDGRRRETIALCKEQA